MNEKKIFEWNSYEFIHKEKKVDWYWALGIIAISGTIISIIYKNYIFAIFIVLASTALAFFGSKPPEIITIKIDRKGIKIQDLLYSYKNIKSFWVNKSEDKLILDSSRAFMPIMVIPTKDINGVEIEEDELRDFLLQFLKEEETKEPMSQKFMDYLGF
ncbi:MAG: hypothetical protein WDK96_02100 [Candidatus Paceibacterota bacterium]|jgi:hypothetical protein